MLLHHYNDGLILFLSSRKPHMISLYILARIAKSTCKSAHLFCKLHVAHKRNSAEPGKWLFLKLVTLETNKNKTLHFFFICCTFTCLNVTLYLSKTCHVMRPNKNHKWIILGLNFYSIKNILRINKKLDSIHIFVR